MKDKGTLPPTRVVVVRRDPDVALRLVALLHRCGIAATVAASDDAARELDHTIAMIEQRAWRAAMARMQGRT